MKDVKIYLYQIVFSKLKVRNLMSQFKKNTIRHILHRREILTCHILNLSIMFTMNLRMDLKNCHSMYMKISMKLLQ
jgi:hypothetical protein